MLYPHVILALAFIFVCTTQGICQDDGTGLTSNDLRESYLADAEALTLTQKKVGDHLISMLDDPACPIQQRLQAGALLGRMKYLPAIDALIRNIELKIPQYDGIRDNPSITRPIVRALAMYGDIAAPQIVIAFSKSHSSDARYLLARSLREAKSTETAIQYARGFTAPENGTELEMERARYLIVVLTGKRQ
ncbi:HEAT repeat domain-containing protein [Blastopirellula marina]|uniref:HEAT repeat domain-containing protein n=1 Tax=Blastopirellula marina TaxID=124 RepID=A0A2S8GQJ2_9BACT|nr:hypothetical protein [Blastopirellula marina]PQO46700.1 hypothetical protein C5Y93_07650 [Blastopirellula marina]